MPVSASRERGTGIEEQLIPTCSIRLTFITFMALISASSYTVYAISVPASGDTPVHRERLSSTDDGMSDHCVRVPKL